MQPPIASAAKTQPTRLLFIASIGNQAPYRRTRHSAGHLLLDELAPRLRANWSQNNTNIGVGVSGAEIAEVSHSQSHLPIGAYYTTWYSPSYMNESGPKLVRQLSKWLGRQDEVVARGTALPSKAESWLEGLVPSSNSAGNGKGYPATLVILHDELEAPLGKIRIKRGGPESASLRGHRGLISVLESLRGKGMYAHGSKVSSNPGRDQAQTQKKGGKESIVPRDLSILRVGIGIGRPDSRAKNAVADYVLTEMDAAEVDAVHQTVAPVMGILEEELFWNGQESTKKK
ncbi:hypothetical protein N7478_011398 [Penicillium angulare]|uniref:uncharacterized protein n=1 Tax=Penicillium angulare TaxID=116970 RepID=UPI002541B0DD|nr:uncharacterized protein N7478_011398 [Penicillium angulare]KAJ5263793.1 hypothetical protein N7478_011398 [Penicillium angulare]